MSKKRKSKTAALPFVHAGIEREKAPNIRDRARYQRRSLKSQIQTTSFLRIGDLFGQELDALKLRLILESLDEETKRIFLYHRQRGALCINATCGNYGTQHTCYLDNFRDCHEYLENERIANPS